MFGNDHPVELEVGFGKGLFLLTARRPAVRSQLRRRRDRPQISALHGDAPGQRGLRNVRVACADARLFLRDCVAAASLQARPRLFSRPVVEEAPSQAPRLHAEFAASARVLRTDGELSTATDVEEYAGVMGATVAALAGFRPLPPPEPGTPAHDLDYLTNFERKAPNAVRDLSDALPPRRRRPMSLPHALLRFGGPRSCNSRPAVATVC